MAYTIELGEHYYEGSIFYDDSTTRNSNSLLSSYEPLSWRLPPEESFSDWTITIKDDSNNDNTTNYYVHKNQLGVGPRKSEYFSKLFRTEGVVEARKKTSEVCLAPSAARAFPVMLDFIYSQDGKLMATTETAPALRHLSNYFGVRELFLKVNGFIQEDLSLGNLPVYWRDASLYNDEVLLTAMVPMAAENFEKMEGEFLSEMSMEQFFDVVSSPILKCNSETLSERVAGYLLDHEDEIDGTVLHALTSSKIMPRISSKSAIFYIKLDANHPSESIESDEETLFSRCVEAFSKGLVVEELFYENQKFRENQVGKDYDALPNEVRLRLLESTLFRARQKNHDLTSENKMIRTENRKLKSEMYDILERDECVIVRGAGVESANGVYTPSGKIDGCTMYMKEGTWKGDKKTFALDRDDKSRWYLSFCPGGETSSTTDWIDIYESDSSSTTPPRDGWKKLEGDEPCPQCFLISSKVDQSRDF